MSRNSHQQRAQKLRASLYEEITARIIADLEQGIVPWVQPWGSPLDQPLGQPQAKSRAGSGDGDRPHAPPGLPRNVTTGKSYSGINILILWGQLFERGFSSQNWLTLRQANMLGGNVRKGEQGTGVCFADKFVPKSHKENKAHRQNAGSAANKGDMPRTMRGESQNGNAQPDAVPFLRRYTVFNVDQCDGLPDH